MNFTSNCFYQCNIVKKSYWGISFKRENYLKYFEYQYDLYILNAIKSILPILRCIKYFFEVKHKYVSNIKYI